MAASADIPGSSKGFLLAHEDSGLGELGNWKRGEGQGIYSGTSRENISQFEDISSHKLENNHPPLLLPKKQQQKPNESQTSNNNMKITSKSLLACAAAALLSGANATGGTGTFSQAGGSASIKTKNLDGSAFSSSVQTSFTGPPVSGTATESKAGINLVEPSGNYYKYAKGQGVAGTGASGAAGKQKESAYIESGANAQGSVKQNKYGYTFDANGIAGASVNGAAMGDSKAGQTAQGSFADGETTFYDGDGVEFFGIAGSKGVVAGGDDAVAVLDGAEEIQGVNDDLFGFLTSTVPSSFPAGRKLLGSTDFLLVGSSGSSAANVANKGTAASAGQVEVASAAELPHFYYEGAQSKSLAAASVGKPGKASNGATAAGGSIAGNECDSPLYGVDASGNCDQFAFSGQSATAANEDYKVGVEATGSAKAKNVYDKKSPYKGSKSGNVNIVETNTYEEGIASGYSFGTASKASNPDSLVIGTGIQTANDVEEVAIPAAIILEEVGIPPLGSGLP